MWPYITIGEIQIYMTGVGIVLSFLTFIAVVFFVCRKLGTSFSKFFYSLPFLVIILYLLGVYSFIIIEHGTFVPSFDVFIQTISPYGYSFHFVGLISGFIIYLIFFLQSIKNPATRKKRIDIFFYAVSISLIPLGVFLTLGDDFIGTSTNNFLGIQAFTEQSKLSKFSKVLPVGLFISFAGITTYMFIEILKKRYKKKGIGYLGFGILSFLFSIVFMFQQYPKHGVAKFFGLTVDIKQYVAWLIAIICIYAYLYTNRRRNNKHI